MTIFFCSARTDGHVGHAAAGHSQHVYIHPQDHARDFEHQRNRSLFHHNLCPGVSAACLHFLIKSKTVAF